MSLVGVFLVAISGYQGYKATKILEEKASLQTTVTEGIYQWKKSYAALGASAKKWDATYTSQTLVPDMLALIERLRLNEYNLNVNTNKIFVSKIESIAQTGVQIGLVKVCLASSNRGDALEVEAANYQTLFSGVEKVAKRLDISIESIEIQGDKKIPIASLNDFCVLLKVQ